MRVVKHPGCQNETAVAVSVQSDTDVGYGENTLVCVPTGIAGVQADGWGGHPGTAHHIGYQVTIALASGTVHTYTVTAFDPTRPQSSACIPVALAPARRAAPLLAYSSVRGGRTVRDPAR